IVLDIVNQPGLMRLEFEVIILLLKLNHFAIRGIEGAVGQTISLSQKGLFLEGIKTPVKFLVKMSLGIKLGKDFLDDFFMARFRGADEIVIGQIESCSKGLPERRQFIAVNLGGLDRKST